MSDNIVMIKSEKVFSITPDVWNYPNHFYNLSYFDEDGAEVSIYNVLLVEVLEADEVKDKQNAEAIFKEKNTDIHIKLNSITSITELSV